MIDLDHTIDSVDGQSSLRVYCDDPTGVIVLHITDIGFEAVWEAK